MQRDHRGVLLLAAEAAAGLRLDDHRQLAAHLERPLHGLVDVVRALQRAVDGDAAILARHRDHGLVLDVELLLVADPVGPLDHHVRPGHGRRRIAAFDGVLGELVLALERVEDRRQSLGPQAEVVTRLAHRRPIGCRDQRHRLGLVADLAAHRHQHRLVVVDQADHVLARDVVGGHDHDSAPVEGVIQVDPQQPGMRLGGADGGAVPGTGEDEVVRVHGQAGQLLRALAAKRCAAGPSPSRRIRGQDQRLGGRVRRQAAGGAPRTLHPCIVARRWWSLGPGACLADLEQVAVRIAEEGTRLP